jgi:hypothetical protein
VSIEDEAREALEQQRSEVALNATAQREVDSILYNPDLDFRKLALDVAYISQGFRLINKADLLGVPFVVTRAIYRPGFPRRGSEGDYVSVEAVVADRQVLETRPYTTENLKVYPNEPVVFNDSGTGIRRELTQLFEKYSLINVGPKTNKNENPLDRQFQLWESGADQAQTGFTGDDVGNKHAIYLALRGLRKSEYDSPYGPATSWYFA